MQTYDDNSNYLQFWLSSRCLHYSKALLLLLFLLPPFPPNDLFFVPNRLLKYQSQNPIRWITHIGINQPPLLIWSKNLILSIASICTCMHVYMYACPRRYVVRRISRWQIPLLLVFAVDVQNCQAMIYHSTYKITSGRYAGFSSCSDSNNRLKNNKRLSKNS